MTQVFMRSVKDEITRNETKIKNLRKFNFPIVTGSLESYQKGKSKVFRLTRTKDGKRQRIYLGIAKSKKFREYLAGLCVVIRISILEHNNKILKRLLEMLEPDTLANVNAKLPAQCRGFLKEHFIDERLEELKAWAAENYERNTHKYSEAVFYACDGTRVRSKGEVIIYNLLYAIGIPFRYDALIYVTDDWGRRVSISPDFLIQCYDGTFIIIEHLGGLKSPDYCSSFATKCRQYLNEGYVLGENLFLTSDDKSGGIDAEAVAAIVDLVERRFYRVA